MIQKNRSSDVQALIQNWSQVEKATTSAINAEGSAMEEYSIHMDTIQASLNTLSSTWQDFSNIFLNSKFLKGGIDTLSTLLDGFGKLIDTVGVLPTLLTGLSVVGTFKNKGFFKLIEDDATLSGKRMVKIFTEVKNNILALDSSLNTSFSFGNDFSNNLNNDIACLNNFINAVAQGESQGVAFSNYMLNASASAKQYAQSMEASSLSVAQFELAQKQSEISLMASNKSMTSTKLLIDEFQGGLKNCGLSQQQFLASIQATNPQLATYLSGLNGANASLKGYIGSLISTKVATIGLQMATMALNMALTMGISAVVSGLISALQNAIVTKSELKQKVEELTSSFEQQSKTLTTNKNEYNELANKYVTLSKGVNSLGENVSLTSSQYEEYNSVVNKIADITPTLVERYNSEGNAILKCKNNVEELTEAYNKLIIANNNKLLNNAGDVFENFKNEMDDITRSKDSGNNKLKVDSAKTLQRLMNSKNRNKEIEKYFKNGYDSRELYQIVNTLEKAGIKRNMGSKWNPYDDESYEDYLKRAFNNNLNVIQNCIDDFNNQIDKKSSKMKTITGAYIDNMMLGEYSNLDDSIKNIINQITSQFDTNFYNKFKSVDELYTYLDKLVVGFSKLSEKDKNKLVAIFDLQTKYNNGEITLDEYKKEVENVNDIISGFDDKTKKLINILFNVDDSEINNIDEKISKTDKNIETNITFSKEGLDKAKSDFDTFYKSIEESMSDTGLSSDTINSIQSLYSNLDGYDASKLFERTALGVKLNRTELEKLQRQYESQNKSAIHSNLRDLIMDYEDLQDKLDRCTDAKERADLEAQMESKEDEINEVKRLASEYDGLISKHYEWLKALSTPNEGDNYDAFVSNLDKVKELYNKGLIGTDDFQKSVQMMTNEDLSGKTAEEIAKVYEEKLPTIKKFFKEGTDGCENFLKAIESLNKGWAKQNKDGSWEFNFDNEKLAKEMGISVDLVEYFLGKLKDLGFEVDLDYVLDDIDSLNKLAKEANKNLIDKNKTDIKFNFDTKNIKDANTEIDKAQKLLDKFKNDDGTINLNIDGASEAQTVLTALIKNRQELNQPAIMDVKLNKDELETNYGKTVTLLQDLQSYSDKLEINLKTGRDTSATKKNIQNTIKEINKSIDKLSEKDKLKLNAKIDIDDLKGRLSTIDANIEAGVEVSDKDIELIRTAVGQVNPEINSKVKVDDSEVEDFKNKDKNTKSTHKVKVDDKELQKHKKKDHSLKSIITYGLGMSFALANIIKHPPKLESVIEFTASGLNTIKTTIQNLFNGNSSNKDNKDKKDKKKDKKGKKSGTSGVDGTAHINGSAFVNGTVKSGNAFVNGKRGDWSVGSSGKALVGELGEELRVRNGKWELIGSDSAEFVDVQPNDIIFNNQQVQQLFKYGKIINGKSRGRALASGSAFVDGTIKSGMAFPEGTGKIITSGKTKKKTTTTSSSSSSKSKSKTKSSSSSSSSDAEKTKETFDWIEIAIERIENAISDLDKIASSVYYSFSTRNDKLRKEYSLVNKEISLQQKAYTRYMKEANSVGLSSKYKKLVQNGKIDISTITDDKLKEKITKYKEWYDKAQNVKDAIADLKLEMRNLRKELFDNISTEYDNYVGRLEKQSNLIQNYISRTESKGMSVSTKYYDVLIKNENKSLSKLQAERKNLLNVLNTGLKKGDLALYSEAWYEMQGKIDDVTESIQMCTNNIIEFQNEIRQIKWDNFDYLHETISQIIDESDFLISLFEDKKLFNDKGNITNIGTSALGLHGMNYNVFMQQSQSYAREIESLNQEIAKTPNDKELISRRNDLIKSQQEMIQSAMSEKQAMIDLVRDGYDLQLDSLQDLIDKYNEALESEKNLYEYNKKVQDQTKNIAKLEKELSAYQGDTTEETKAKVQQLKVSLEEAKGELQETEYQRYIQNQQDLLDNIYSEYEDIINAKFEDVDALFSELIKDVNSNSTTINSTLVSESDKVGYTLSNSMETIWGNTGDVLSDFSNGFNEFSGKFDTYAQNGTTTIESWLSTINSNLVAMVNASDKTATNDVSKATSTKYTATAKNTTTTNNSKTNTKSNNTKNTNKTSTSTTSKTAGYISSIQSLITSSSSSSIIKKVQTALKALGFKGKDKKALSVDGIWGANTDYAVKSFQKYSGYGGAITADGKIGKNTKAKFKKAGYKKGIYNLNKNELAWTQEDNKPEIIIRKSDGAILTPLSKGDSVLSNNATSNIWSMANDPTKFIKDNLNNNLDISNGNNNISNNTVQNDINMNITLPNVKNYNEFVNQLQKDSKFERMIQDMTVNQLSGKSSLSKFKYKFK